jgi:4-hydroxy-3-methylbut-2-enyl diphosphate reductase
VQQIIARLAPRDGVEIVHVTDEDEYFPPPPELRDVLRGAAAALALAFGAPADDGAPTAGDRSVSAAEVLRPTA